MARRWVIQHRTTGDFLGLYPSLNQDPTNPPDIRKLHVSDIADAASYSTGNSAELERRGISDFADAYDVKMVELASLLDIPRLVPEPKGRGQEEPPEPAEGDWIR